MKGFDRVGLSTPRRRDYALVAVVMLLSAAMLWAPSPAGDGSGWASVAVLILLEAQAVTLGLRRVNPLLCTALILGLQTVLAGVVEQGQGVRGAALAVAVYTCGTLLPARRALVVAGVAALTEVGGYVLLSALPAALSPNPPRTPAALAGVIAGQLLAATLLYVGAAVVGQNIGLRRRYAEMVELRAAADAAAQQARVEAALSAERTRMARELHDSAAHHLTSMIVQAAVVERLLDQDPAAARSGAAGIRAEGKNVLRDLRLIVGALRENDPPSPVTDAGAPGLGTLGDLVAAHGHSTLRVCGEPRDIPQAADLTFYRVAQEALSNARDHAPGAAVRITVRHRAEDSTLEVHNGPPVVAGAPAARTHRGFGLIGMRERAALIGARLAAGPTSDGGWLVELTVPRDAVTGAEASA